MKILVIHNKYRRIGGEDAVSNYKINLLRSRGHSVESFLLNNALIDQYSSQQKLSMVLSWNSNHDILNSIEKKINDFKPDIIHTHNVFPLITPRVYKLIGNLGYPVVQTLHNFRFICPNGLMFRENHVCEECIEKKSFLPSIKHRCYRNSLLQSAWYSNMLHVMTREKWLDNVTRFIALNPFVKDKLVSNNFKSEKFKIIPNALDLDKVATDDADFEYYLYIGRLSEEKGIDTMLKTFTKLNDKKLLIVGDGPLKERVQESDNLNSNIEYLGFVSGEEKLKLIAKAIATLVPSECYENLPTTVIESLSQGTPCIVSKIGGVQYMVKDEVNGYTFEPGNIEDLVNKIKLIDPSTQHYMSMRAKSREVYEKTYTSEVVYSQLMDVYNDAIKEVKGLKHE